MTKLEAAQLAEFALRAAARLVIAGQQLVAAQNSATAAGQDDISEEQVDDAFLYALAQRSIAIGAGNADPTPGFEAFVKGLLEENGKLPLLPAG